MTTLSFFTSTITCLKLHTRIMSRWVPIHFRGYSWVVPVIQQTYTTWWERRKVNNTLIRSNTQLNSNEVKVNNTLIRSLKNNKKVYVKDEYKKPCDPTLREFRRPGHRLPYQQTWQCFSRLLQPETAAHPTFAWVDRSQLGVYSVSHRKEEGGGSRLMRIHLKEERKRLCDALL